MRYLQALNDIAYSERERERERACFDVYDLNRGEILGVALMAAELPTNDQIHLTSRGCQMKLISISFVYTMPMMIMLL